MTKARWAFLLSVSIGGAAGLAACGDTGTSPTVFPDPPADSGPSGDGSAPTFRDGSAVDTGVIALAIQPADPILDATGTPVTVQFSAMDHGSPTSASWILDSPSLGSIDANGLFTATGTAAGSVTVYAQAGGIVAHTSLTVRLTMTENPGGLDTTSQALLRGGGAGDSTFTWLYPYDKTVFPRGLLAPTLQFAGGPAAAYFLKIASKNLNYEGFFGGTNPMNLVMEQALWDTVTTAAMASDPVAVSMTKLSTAGDGGVSVTGPITESWTIAQGSLKGIVYYNTYDSPIAAGDAGADAGNNDQGAIMRIRPGERVPDVLLGGQAKGGCTVCHTVAANGSVISVSAGHLTSQTYDLSADGGAPTPRAEQPGDTWSFGALTPDGRYLLSNGSVRLDAGIDDSGMAVGVSDFSPNVVSLIADQSSLLYDTRDGGVVGSIPGVTKAMMPSFSPDGTKLAFNWYGQSAIAVVDFDAGSHAFTGSPTVAVQDPDNFLSWPAFLPDARSLLYQFSSDTGDFASYTPSYEAANGELLIWYSAVNDTHHLYNLLGVDPLSPHDSYVKDSTGAADGTARFMNYEPTVLPVASGGYYWVVVSSRRTYGNLITSSDPSDGARKKLWVAAVDVAPDPTSDPSHPAFFLDGQEMESGNLRGFWALEPCRAVGNDCRSGADCCGGFCRETSTDGGSAFRCVSKPTSCSQEDEKCTATADCCGAAAGFDCINGFCARPTPK